MLTAKNQVSGTWSTLGRGLVVTVSAGFLLFFLVPELVRQGSPLRHLLHLLNFQGSYTLIEQRIFDAFETMWGPFPEPVMLIRKDRTILAVNRMAREIGTPVGVKCHSLNPEVKAGESHCSACKANQAIRTGQTVSSREQYGTTDVIGYWMPLVEEPEIYVHFGVGTAELMAGRTSKAQLAGNEQDLVKLS